MTCPKCRGETVSKLILVDKGGWWKGVTEDSIPLDICGACGGTWFDKGECTQYLERRLEAAPKPPQQGEASRKLLDARVASCPRCSVTLERRRRGDITIDSCSACGGVFLDAGEYPVDLRDSLEQRLAKLLAPLR